MKLCVRVDYIQLQTLLCQKREENSKGHLSTFRAVTPSTGVGQDYLPGFRKQGQQGPVEAAEHGAVCLSGQFTTQRWYCKMVGQGPSHFTGVLQNVTVRFFT